jgi:hypothetical protein
VKLWLISQNVNTGYDVYDSAVVAAHHETHARHIHPGGPDMKWESKFSTWASEPDQVKVKEIGEALEGTEPGVICRSHRIGRHSGCAVSERRFKVGERVEWRRHGQQMIGYIREVIETPVVHYVVYCNGRLYRPNTKAITKPT